MGLSDSRPGRFVGYVFPPSVARFRSPPGRASQAPRLIFPRALPPSTPEGPLAAFACCFTRGLVWLHPSRRTGHLRIPIEAESGSLALRLACSPPDAPAASLLLALVRLHAEQAIYMVNSLQFTRSARLTLAYRPKGAVAGNWTGYFLTGPSFGRAGAGTGPPARRSRRGTMRPRRGPTRRCRPSFRTPC